MTAALASVQVVPIGRDQRFKPTAALRRVTASKAAACGSRGTARFGVHLELFAAGRVVVVPAGIGVAWPARRQGAYVVPLGCRFSLSTIEPTGVVEVTRGTHATLGDLFDLWRQALSQRSVAGFRGRVRVFVDGHRRRGDPRAVRLLAHRQIVLAVGASVPVHPSYTFRPGL